MDFPNENQIKNKIESSVMCGSFKEWKKKKEAGKNITMTERKEEKKQIK